MTQRENTTNTTKKPYARGGHVKGDLGDLNHGTHFLENIGKDQDHSTRSGGSRKVRVKTAHKKPRNYTAKERGYINRRR